MGGVIVRTIGLARAKAKVGMNNLAYDLRRLVQLQRCNHLRPAWRKGGRTCGPSREVERIALKRPRDGHKTAHEPASEQLNANCKPVAGVRR